MTFTVWDGVEERSVAWTILDDDLTEQPVSAVAMVPGGAWSVDRLAEIPGFTIAHRCGSADWAEMSQRGATASVLRNVDALEISVSRTIDGVWFGLHDQTLLRTSGVDINPNTLTWAQVQGYLSAAPAGGDPAFGAQPYARLVDLLDAYATSHVIFLDPKYHAGVAWRDEFFAVIESAVPNAQDHVVIKYTGGGITLADDATARGYTSVGYFYESEYAPDPAGTLANAAHWTWIELDHGAPQSTWDAFTALGKLMIGFIAATAAQRQTALDKGADGVMCSGIRAIKGAAVI